MLGKVISTKPLAYIFCTHWILSPSFLKGLWQGNDKCGKNNFRKALDVTETREHKYENFVYEIRPAIVVNKEMVALTLAC